MTRAERGGCAGRRAPIAARQAPIATLMAGLIATLAPVIAAGPLAAQSPQQVQAAADEAIRLVPPRDMTLEKAIEFIADDEFVEVTPKSIRLRKKVLDAKRRPKRWQEIRASTEAS